LRVPVSWLRDYVPLEMPLPELAERLSISTAEVEGIERRGVPDENGNLGLFRVGRVVEAAKHPNADRLQLCRVDIGEGEPRQIVCGAWNFGAGATVAVALPGAVLPGGLELEQRNVRGELSDGMILAEDEVALGTDHSGIMVLPETEPGTPLGDVLPLVEEVLLVESTGNRPDLLSVYGLAREIAALYELELGQVPGSDPEPGPERAPVEAVAMAAPPSLELEQLQEAWQRTIVPAVEERSIPAASVLREAHPAELAGDTLTVEFPASASFHRQLAEEPKNATLLADALYEVTGRHLGVAFAEGEARADAIEDEEPAGEERILELVKETLDAHERED
jgi:tRNA-binding EMAP/Myf-like protein